MNGEKEQHLSDRMCVRLKYKLFWCMRVAVVVGFSPFFLFFFWVLRSNATKWTANKTRAIQICSALLKSFIFFSFACSNFYRSRSSSTSEISCLFILPLSSHLRMWEIFGCDPVYWFLSYIFIYIYMASR